MESLNSSPSVNPESLPGVISDTENQILHKLLSLQTNPERAKGKVDEVRIWFQDSLPVEKFSSSFVSEFLIGLKRLIENEKALEVVYSYMVETNSERHFRNALKKYKHQWLKHITQDQLRVLIQKLYFEKNWLTEEEIGYVD